ncbi:MAG: hypothetical protein SFU56_07630 [Capsulimonadales bacterium]|nr:hypothetical protein [Capsulimonadales bacterium]
MKSTIALFQEDELPPKHPRVTDKRPTKVETILKKVDWHTYEQNVLTLVKGAITSFSQSPEVTPVCQLSLLTDAQTGHSILSFETRKNRADVEEKDNHFVQMEKIDRVPHTINDNPREFRFWAWASYYHRELDGLNLLDFAVPSHRQAADRRIAASLRNVINTCWDGNVLMPLPLDLPFHIGINGVKDWFCVVKVLK